MPLRADPLSLSEDEHQELQRMSLSRSLPAMLAEGRSYTGVQKRLNTTAPTISKWRKRFLEQRLDGLMQEHPGGIGQSDPLFRRRSELLASALDLLMSCKCESGCPSCVGPPNEIGPKGKAAAVLVLTKLLIGTGAQA